MFLQRKYFMDNNNGARYQNPITRADGNEYNIIYVIIGL